MDGEMDGEMVVELNGNHRAGASHALTINNNNNNNANSNGNNNNDTIIPLFIIIVTAMAC